MLISISLLCILIHIWVATSSQIGSSTNLVVANREKKDLNIEQNSFIYGWLHGDIGGSAFDDKEELEFPDRTSCVGVEVVWQPSHLYALRFIYGSDDKAGWSMFRGNYTLNSSSREKFMMKPGERITQITTYVGTQGWSVGGKLITFVLGIRFGTNKGRSSQVYGSRSGEKKVEIHDGYVVGHASGRAGILIDQLQFVWQNQETVKVSAEKQFTVLCPDLPESVTLAIISASYRNKEEPKSEVKDVVNRVRQRCNNEKSCSFKVDDEILKTTPCESCPKELEVTYTCSDQEFVFGPEQNDRVYKGHNIMINGKKYLTGVDDYLRCGEHCLKEPKCVGIQFNPDQQCYLKSAMTTYIEKPGWISMAVANRGRDT